ncbi:Alpha/Beta hydrolase protein [Rhypophila decipiens]
MCSLCTQTSYYKYLFIAAVTMSASAAQSSPATPGYVPLYQTLPPTPVLPSNARFFGSANINNISLWYTLYGPPLNKPQKKLPVVLLHGGKISSRWLTHQIKYLSSPPLSHPVIAIDTRSHGRSSDDPSVPLSYSLFANDTATLLRSHLGISRAGFVGWSDGANTILSLLIDHHSTPNAALVDRAFIFGANYRYDQLNVTGLLRIPFLNDLAGRMQSEWTALTPNLPKDYAAFSTRVSAMQDTSPSWSAGDFGKIKTLYQDPKNAPIVWIVDGDSEEIVQRSVAGEMRDMIWGSSLVILPDVGHFAPVQDPGTFNAMLARWIYRER